MHPKLTVGVPHLDRTEFLGKTIECLLGQISPCRILVADQGMTDATAELMHQYKDNPLVSHRRTDATCLWENWREAAEMAMDDGAEYFAWCQDDDIVHERYSERITIAFDTFADAQTWTAILAISEDEDLAMWFTGVGPLVPMNLLRNRPMVIDGDMLTPFAYVTSWALSPAVAFRCGQDFRDAMAEVPEHCDLFTERTILAAMGRKGKVVCDPVRIGYWRHHGKNESYRQNLVEKPEQQKSFLKWLDGMMDDLPNWADQFGLWAEIMPNAHLRGHAAGLDGMDSRYVHAVKDVLTRSMREEVLYDDLRRQLNPQPEDPVFV
ncbi:MAG: glycosyltransferase family A protein [Candidatus Pacebacteria bacterium]|nr:glycosyltransferase family A protein [Candidatus Paceibacterota bacterium]